MGVSWLTVSSLFGKIIWPKILTFNYNNMPISENVLVFVLIIVDVLLITSILLQQRQGGLSTVFGGEGSVYRSKRGIARGLHYFTIFLAVAFAALSVVIIFLK
jgi:protein translocase SecG subunit